MPKCDFNKRVFYKFAAYFQNTFSQKHLWVAASDLKKIYVKVSYLKNRSSQQRCSMIKGVLKKYAKLTGKHLCQSLFLNKVAGLRPATLLKKRLWHWRFL